MREPSCTLPAMCAARSALNPRFSNRPTPSSGTGGRDAHLLVREFFGDHFTRAGIDLRTRELLTFSMLVSLGGCEPQVKGHVSANLNIGNNRARLIDVVTQLLPFIGYPRTLNGLRMIDEVTLA
jgi:alkylhydroperoxidase/carboxymuconolactone decarboxylase family protein YurZ